MSRSTTPPPNRWHVRPGPIAARRWVVEPDLSNSVPFLAAAVVTGGMVRIAGWPGSASSPPRRSRIVRTAGIDCAAGGFALDVNGAAGYRGFDVDLHDVGELTPAVAALAALAAPGSVSRLTGIAHLRGHERPTGWRPCAPRSTGSAATAPGDAGRAGHHRGPAAPRYLALLRRPPNGDGGAIIGLRVPGVEVEDIGTTAKTLPDFPELWTDMLGRG